MVTEMDLRFQHEDVREYRDGDCVFAEGDEGRELYIIQEGSVLIRKKTEVGELDLAEFGRGDFFGDMALLQGGHRFAAAYAKGPTRLLILKPGGFLLKIRRDPTFAFEMLQQLSYRVRVSNQRLIESLKIGQLPPETVKRLLLAAGQAQVGVRGDGLAEAELALDNESRPGRE